MGYGEYITAREASDKWGLSVRQVQSLCDMGKVPQAIRFNRCWAIPSDTPRPADKRCKAPSGKAEVPFPLELSRDKDCSLFHFATFFPYPMQIMAPDGTLMLFNDALKRMFRISDTAAEKLTGKYNMLKHPMMSKWGLKGDIERLFLGEQVQWRDMKVPLQEISNLFGEGELTTGIIYQDIFGFTIFDETHRAAFVIIIYITSRLYNGKEEITKGKEYIENHWREKFDLEAAAKASGLSRGHFERLFKTHTGLTPHKYYLDMKMKMLQRKLEDFNLSVSQAFEECGMEYNSHYTGVFKQLSGMTPTDYRKMKDN